MRLSVNLALTTVKYASMKERQRSFLMDQFEILQEVMEEAGAATVSR